MLPPNIVIETPGVRAYMQKVKPEPLGQADIELLAARLQADPAKVSTFVLDDVLVDPSGGRHQARRLTVTAEAIALPEGARTTLDDAPPAADAKPKRKYKPRAKK